MAATKPTPLITITNIFLNCSGGCCCRSAGVSSPFYLLMWIIIHSQSKEKIRCRLMCGLHELC